MAPCDFPTDASSRGLRTTPCACGTVAAAPRSPPSLGIPTRSRAPCRSPTDVSSSWSHDDTLRLWDGHSGAPLPTLHENWSACALPLHDGRILSYSGDSILRLWDGRSGTPLATFATLVWHAFSVTDALPLSDGRILSLSLDEVCLWDDHSGAPIATLDDGQDTQWIYGALTLPDGRILTWSWDKILRLWDGQSGAPLATLAGHTECVEGARLLPDGRILSWSEDKTLRLWDGQSGQPIGEPIAQTDLCWKHPQIWLYQWEAECPAGVSNQTAGWSRGSTAGIATCAIQTDPICWQGHAEVTSGALFPEGILVVTLASGHVFCLQLHRGNQRITIADYEHSGTAPGEGVQSAPPDSNPCDPWPSQPSMRLAQPGPCGRRPRKAPG